jgi:hypothetical protein
VRGSYCPEPGSLDPPICRCWHATSIKYHVGPKTLSFGAQGASPSSELGGRSPAAAAAALTRTRRCSGLPKSRKILLSVRPCGCRACCTLSGEWRPRGLRQTPPPTLLPLPLRRERDAPSRARTGALTVPCTPSVAVDATVTAHDAAASGNGPPHAAFGLPMRQARTICRCSHAAARTTTSPSSQIHAEPHPSQTPIKHHSHIYKIQTRDGEDELIENSLREEPPLSKLGLSAVGCGGLALTALIISSLAGQDPFGPCFGMRMKYVVLTQLRTCPQLTRTPPPSPSTPPGGASLSLHSLQSAAVGALCAIPLVAFRAFTWTKEASDQAPALSDMHRLMAEEAEPWLSQFNRGHLAAHSAIETLSTLLLLLPAAQGGVAAGFAFYSSVLQQTLFGVGGAAAAAALADGGDGAAAAAAAATPEGLGAVLALAITATVAGVVQSLNLGQDEERVEVVRDAVQNADRWASLVGVWGAWLLGVGSVWGRRWCNGFWQPKSSSASVTITHLKKHPPPHTDRPTTQVLPPHRDAGRLCRRGRDSRLYGFQGRRDQLDGVPRGRRRPRRRHRLLRCRRAVLDLVCDRRPDGRRGGRARGERGGLLKPVPADAARRGARGGGAAGADARGFRVGVRR